MMRTLLLAGCVAEQPKTVPWGEHTPAQTETAKSQ